jgi:nitroreductase
MTDEEVQKLLSLAVLSPTAFNIQHWRFVRVADQDLRRQIRAVSWDQAQVTDASLLLVLCADVDAWKKNPQRYWRNAPQEAQDTLVPAILGYYEGREQVARDEALRSCGIVAQTIMLAAKGMGYDSCPMDGFDFSAVASLINLPSDHVIAMMIAVGKSTKEPWPRGGQLPLEDVLFTNRF